MGSNFNKEKHMTNRLRVKTPFFNLEVGDILTLSEDKKFYEHVTSEGYDNKDSHFKFDASFKVDAEYANELVNEGYLEIVIEKVAAKDFKNIFTEIDILIDTYSKELSNLDEEFKEKPACLKVEKRTVLKNLIKVLNHLKTLKK